MNKIPIINEKDNQSLTELALKNDGLTAPKELSDMLMTLNGVSISSKPRKDGRYQGYISENGVRNYVYGKTREEVAIILKEYLKNGIPKRKKKTTPLLKEWLEKWIKLYKEPNLKIKSLESLKNALKSVIKRFGDKRLNELKTDDLQEFFLSMTAERVRDMAIMNLRSALTKAVKQGIIKSNPCDALEIKAHKKAKKTALTLEEQKTLIAIVKNSPYEALFKLLLTTGVRIGEALALTSADVDFSHNIIYINKNVVFVKGQKIVQDTTKTESGVRAIPTPKSTLDLLSRTAGDIFPYTYNAVKLFFDRLTLKTGIKVNPHKLRHTYATRLEEASISPKVKQYLMGHSSLEMTQNTYTEIQKHHIDTLKDKISSVFDT